MSKEKSLQLTKQLYELQKKYIKNMLLSKNAQQHHNQFIEFFFQKAEQITLKQVIDLQQLIGVIEDQVFKVNLAPPMLSVIGEIAQNLHHQLSHNNSAISTFMSDQQLEHWLRKIFELDHVFEYIRSRIEQTPQIRALCAYWINQNITRYTPEQLHVLSEKTKAKLPLKLQSFINTQQQRLEEKFEEKAAQLFQQQLIFLFSLDKDEYLTLALSLWDTIKHKPISEFISKSSALDSEELFILIYEFWKDFRHNTSVQDLIKNSTQYFYETFEEESLLYLFQSTGLSIKDIQNEALRFAPPILQRLEQLTLLDQYIDFFLADFFEQEETLYAIEQAIGTTE